jgi:Outer membrane protein beta-barrel domain
MKKNCLLLILGTSMSFYAIAQSDNKPFKVDVSAGYAITSGSGSKGGVLFVVEPKYAVMPNLSLGLRLETAVVARFDGYDQNGDPQDVSVKASASYLATGDYYFNDNYSFHPFVGAGVGVFTLASASSNSDGVSTGSKFGGMIRAGIEVSHFRFGIEYNIIPKTTFDGFDNNGDPATLTSKNGYIGIKLGVCLGGGPR